MAQWILNTNGEVISRHTLMSLHVDELHYAIDAKKRYIFDALIERGHGGSIKPSNIFPSSNDDGEALPEPCSTYQDDDDPPD